MSAATCPFEHEVLLLGDGELEFTRRIVVEAHLGVCASCAELEEAVTLVDEVIAAEVVAPLGAAERALARLPDSSARLRPLVVAAAAAALVFVGARSSLQGARRAEPRPAPITSAVAEDDPPPANGAPARPAVTSVAAPLAPLPQLPPPMPPAGPTLRRRLAALDADAVEFDEQVRRLAADVRRRGPRSARALAAILADDGPLLRPALEVAAHVKDPGVTQALAERVDHPLFGDLAARALADGRDPDAVPTLVRHLDGAGALAAREALAEIGGSAAARALVERFWEAPAEHREAWLHAAVRADVLLGGAACLEALAVPAETGASDASAAFADTARAVLRARSERLLPFLRRTAIGRDGLRARLAARALGWCRDHASRAVLAELACSPRTADAATAALLDLGSSAAVDDAVAAARLGGDEGPAARAFDDRPEAEARLLDLVTRADRAERRLALALLARCGGPAAARALGATTFPRALQGDLVATLGAIGGAEAARALGPLADASGLENDVITALGATASPAAVPWLQRIAVADPRRRPRIVTALARLDVDESVDALVAMLPDERAGAAALEALAELPARRVVPALLQHCGDDVPLPVRRALARIAGRDLGSSPAPWREWWAART